MMGSAEADLRLQSERRAMQELHRFQKLSAQALAAAESTEPTEPTLTAGVEAALLVQPPVAPPTRLYANLPSEWPLESVYGCGVSVCFCGSRCTGG